MGFKIMEQMYISVMGTPEQGMICKAYEIQSVYRSSNDFDTEVEMLGYDCGHNGTTSDMNIHNRWFMYKEDLTKAPIYKGDKQ